MLNKTKNIDNGLVLIEFGGIKNEAGLNIFSRSGLFGTANSFGAFAHTLTEGITA